MKFLKILNTVALTIPLVIAMIGFISEEYFILSLVSTMATGFPQLIAGIFYWYEFPKSIPIKIYFILVRMDLDSTSITLYILININLFFKK